MTYTEPDRTVTDLMGQFADDYEHGRNPNVDDYLANAAEHSDRCRDELGALISSYLAELRQRT
jgi:hypothetical protein